MVFRRTLLGLTALVALAAPALAQQSYLGASVGSFFPSSSALRDKLGDNWLSYGPTSVRIDSSRRQRVTSDWQAFSKSKDGNKVFMLSLSGGILYPLGDQMSTRPYAAARAGLGYIDYAINVTGGRESGKRFGPTGNVEVGVNIGERLNLHARYDLFPSYAGFNFSGFSIALQYGITRF